ncbi:MAG: hypothetical protein CL878_14665 [Dehalococcoidia bacterium]|nr:hypothetical protein [Dehalococcoidia bacterium]
MASMAQTSLYDAVDCQLKVDILGYFWAHVGASTSARRLAARLGRDPAAVQQAIHELVTAGALAATTGSPTPRVCLAASQQLVPSA